MAFAAGQQWTYRAPPELQQSRLIIGAILTFEGRDSIICCSATCSLRQHPDGSLEAVSIPFIPMTETAFRASVLEQDGTAEPPAAFADELHIWSNDPRGLTIFTVPFEGQLDRMIAMQMAEIVGRSAA